MQKIISTLKESAKESVVYLKSLKGDYNIPNDIKNKLLAELDQIEQTMNIQSSGITTQWLYLMKTEQVNKFAYSLGHLSTLICSVLPSSEIEKAKSVMIATNVLSTYLSMEIQSQF